MSTDDAALHASFKTAASTLTQLYVTSLRSTKRARDQGYAAALQEVAALAGLRRGDPRLADELLAFCGARLAELESNGAGGGQGNGQGTGFPQTGHSPAGQNAAPASPTTMHNSPSLSGLSLSAHVAQPPGLPSDFSFSLDIPLPLPSDSLKRRNPSNPFEFNFLGRTFGIEAADGHEAKRRRRGPHPSDGPDGLNGLGEREHGSEHEDEGGMSL